MKLRLNLDEARLGKGFTPENDIFQLDDLAKRLTSLVGSLSQGSVSVLDGRWGTGKSTFVKMWVAQLEQKGIPAIYFDAFSADYIQDPFQAVSSSFVKAAIDRRRTEDPAYQRYLAAAASTVKRLAGVSAKAGIKLITLGAIAASELDELATLKDEIASAGGEITEEAVKSLLERQATDQESFAVLRRSLAELPDLLRPQGEFEAGNSDTNVPLVVVIDELDRCRPDFALGILEVLKHFFRMDRLHFILVTNMDHLALSVAQRYGMSSAADEYLQKFYDFVVHFEHRYTRHDLGNVST